MEHVTDLNQIRNIILQTINDGGGYSIGDLKETVVQGADQNRFLVVRTGWAEGQNFYALLQDIELRDGRVLIHQDNQEDDVAEDLVDAGIAADTIVKTYLNPEERPSIQPNS